MQLLVKKSLESVAYDFLAPITDGLTLWSFLGGNAIKSAKNYAPGKAGSTVVGAPAFSERYATLLPGANYLITQAPQSADATLIAIARPVSDAGANIFSNYTSATVTAPPPTTRGTDLYFEPSTPADGKVSLTYNQSIKDGSNDDQYASVTKALASNVGAFSMVSGRCINATGSRQVKDWTTGLDATSTSGFAVNVGVTPLYVGGAPTISPYTTNAVDIAFVAAYSRALSDSELAEIYAWAKAYYATRGITI